MKDILLIIVLFMTAVSASAQERSLTDEQRLEQKRQEMRVKLDLDYSVPDYDVKRPDEKVMGWRLAKILLSLEREYKQGLYNRMLSRIQNVQMGEPEYRYSVIDKIKIFNIKKRDSVITVKINTFTKDKEAKSKINFDIILSFINGVSDDDIANTLFMDIARYIREFDDDTLK